MIKKILLLMLLIVCISVAGPAWSGNLDKAIIMVSVDDNDWTLYSYVYPIMSSYDLPFTAYVITSRFGTAGYSTWPQIWEMYWNGLEIGNHGDKHLNYTGKSYTTIYNDIYSAKTKFVNQGLVGVTTFAYPFGVKNSNVVKALKTLGLTSGRGAWDEFDQFNYPATFDQWWIESLSFRNMTKTSNFSQLKPYIDEAVATKAGLSIVLHSAYPGAVGAYELDSAELEKTAAYLSQLRSEGEVEVETVTRGVSKLLHFKSLP